MAEIPDVDELRDLLDAQVAEREVAGAAVGLSVGEDVVTAASGVANKATGVEVTTDTLFQIGSVTKVYTATLVMQLVEEGLVDLDAAAERYLPDVRIGDYDEARSITVRQLLSHTSGMAGDHFADHGRGDDAIERFCAALSEQPKVHEPDEIMSYCNAGYVVLGRLVEVLRDRPWHAAVDDLITGPIGATDTVHLAEDAILRPVAVGHLPDPEDPTGPSSVAPRWSLPAAIAPAGSVTCAPIGDLLAFGRLHLAGGTAPDGSRVLSEASVKTMQQPQVELPSRAVLNASAWGLGWIIFDWDGTRVVGHDGNTLGQSCFLRLLPDADAAVAIQVNDARGGAELVDAVSRRVFTDVFGVTIPEEPTPLDDAGDVALEPYAGTYAQENYEVEVRLEDGHLVADVTPTTEHARQMMAAKEGLALRPAGGQDFVLDDPARTTPVTFAAFGEDGRPRFLHMGARALVRIA